jgi:hypothetical protein
MKQKVYVEASIITYATNRPGRDLDAAARQELTLRWWEQAAPLFDLVTSDIAIREAEEHNRAANLAVFSGLARLAQNEEALSLSNRLVEAGLFPETARTDALHIAIAAVHKCDYLLTWKCESIANARRRRQFESIVEKAGFACPAICTPSQLHGGVPLCSDPIIEEVCRVRDELARKFNYDLGELVEYLREKEQEHPDRMVSLRPSSDKNGA